MAIRRKPTLMRGDLCKEGSSSRSGTKLAPRADPRAACALCWARRGPDFEHRFPASGDPRLGDPPERGVLAATRSGMPVAAWLRAGAGRLRTMSEREPRSRSVLRRSILVASLLTASSAAGCAGDRDGAPSSVDSVQLKLDFGGGVTLNTVDYLLAGPGSFHRAGTLPVGDQPTIMTTFQNLPAGTGYDVMVKGSASDDSSICKGEAMFDVAASMNAVVQIALTCSGRAAVSTDFNACPTIDSLSVIPAEAYVGSSVLLTTAAHDPDNGPSPLIATWSTSSGMLTNLTTTGATFTCTAPGSFKISLSVSDGTPNPKCADTASVMVVCSPGGA
jgi:hypothetical protein